METSLPFVVFPAIDLRAGQVVRLKEGDPTRQTNYSSHPAAAANRWIEAGASWLHVVNLDGAFGEADSANMRALTEILAEAQKTGVQVQFGGGIRSREMIDTALSMGVSRVVVGTLAVEEPNELDHALAHWGPERIAVSLDARDGFVMVRGWQAGTPLAAIDLAKSLRERGLEWLVFTDIARDGLQTGLNLPATRHLAAASGLRVIASGGVRGMEDVREAQTAGLAGVIVGRALYEGTVDPIQLFGENGC